MPISSCPLSLSVCLLCMSGRMDSGSGEQERKEEKTGLGRGGEKGREGTALCLLPYTGQEAPAPVFLPPTKGKLSREKLSFTFL